MYKRRLITISDNLSNVRFDLTTSLKNTVLRDPSVIDEFYYDKTINSDGSESISVVDPIYILFNQERLNSLGATAAQSFLDSLQPKSDALAELRKKCSDEDLMKMMKSRHLQSPAEILSWCRYMQQNVDTFNKEVQAFIEEQSRLEQGNSNVEPQTSE